MKPIMHDAMSDVDVGGSVNVTSVTRTTQHTDVQCAVSFPVIYFPGFVSQLIPDFFRNSNLELFEMIFCRISGKMPSKM